MRAMGMRSSAGIAGKVTGHATSQVNAARSMSHTRSAAYRAVRVTDSDCREGAKWTWRRVFESRINEDENWCSGSAMSRVAGPRIACPARGRWDERARGNQPHRSGTKYSMWGVGISRSGLPYWVNGGPASAQIAYSIQHVLR